MTVNGAAAAVWLLPPLVRFLGLRTAPVLKGLERMEERHPQDRSHWYLFILAPSKRRRNEGWARPCWPTCWTASTPTANPESER
jgi:hypothetical protein